MATIVSGRIIVSCSWCHGSVIATGRTICPECGHRADVARVDCDCDGCLALNAAATGSVPRAAGTPPSAPQDTGGES